MSAKKENRNLARGGYEHLVWVNDENGKEFSCTLDSHRENITKIDQLTDHEQKSCMDVNLLVGTERW